MNARFAGVAFACILAGAATIVFWHVAAAAARRRRMDAGAFPPLLPAIVTMGAAIAASCDAPLSAVIAMSGATVAGWVDARTGAIFDRLSLALLAAFAIPACSEGRMTSAGAGASAVGASLLVLFAVTRGRGIGLGDVKLGAVLGFALGVTTGLAAIGAAFVFGAIYGTGMIIAKRARRGSAIRFGPFIAGGTYAAVLVPVLPR